MVDPKVLNKLRRKHDLAVRALGRSLRANGGSVTAERERANFERHEDEFFALLDSLMPAEETSNG